MSIGLLIPKDLGNRRNYIVILYREAAHKSWEGLQLFWERVPPPYQEKSLLEKLPPTQKIALSNANSTI